MTAIPVDPVPAAALLGGVLDLLVLPETTACPNCGGDGIYPEMPDGRPAECWMCYREGVVLFPVPSPGDVVTIAVGSDLPADGTRYGDRVVRRFDPIGPWLLEHPPVVPGERPGETLSLRPGSRLTATISELLPIDAAADAYEHDRSHITVGTFGGAIPAVTLWTLSVTALLCGSWDASDITPQTVWQSGEWTSGRTVARLTDIAEETP